MLHDFVAASLDSGNLVFMVENQAVLYWGVTASTSPDEDPPVLQGVNKLPESIEWYPEQDRCSDFLLVMLHTQAVFGGFDWLATARIDAKLVQHFETQWRRVGTLEGTIAYNRVGQVACVFGDTGDRHLYVGARSEKLFEQIESELEAAGVGLSHL